MNQHLNWPVVKLAAASVVGHVCLLLVIALHVKKSNVDFTSPVQRPFKIVQASLIAFQLPKTNNKKTNAVDKPVAQEDEKGNKIASKPRKITDEKVSTKSTTDNEKDDDKESIAKKIADKSLLKTANNQIDIKSKNIVAKVPTASTSSILKASRQFVNLQRIQHPSFARQNAKAGMSVMDKPLPVHQYQEIIVDQQKERLVVGTCDSAVSKIAVMASALLNGTLRCQQKEDLIKYIEARRQRKPNKELK